jgi:hypothetical protein
LELKVSLQARDLAYERERSLVERIEKNDAVIEEYGRDLDAAKGEVERLKALRREDVEAIARVVYNMQAYAREGAEAAAVAEGERREAERGEEAEPQVTQVTEEDVKAYAIAAILGYIEETNIAAVVGTSQRKNDMVTRGEESALAEHRKRHPKTLAQVEVTAGAPPATSVTCSINGVPQPRFEVGQRAQWHSDPIGKPWLTTNVVVEGKPWTAILVDDSGTPRTVPQAHLTPLPPEPPRCKCGACERRSGIAGACWRHGRLGVWLEDGRFCPNCGDELKSPEAQP